ncbi:oxidoreductase [Halomicroarcula sp. GCM10025709]|uniref:DUF7521 family protein n=1 Tax=Haloarcula TaxID=2237 RepID=UPI0024C406FB|nr:oxidoreductase [Halomicroarcula sp. YJ-61-S]
MIPTTTSTVLLVVVTAATLVVGGSIAHLAHRAARRTDSEPLRLFSYGFGIIAVGVAVSGLVSLVTTWTTGEVLLVQGGFVLVGLAFLVRSLYVGTPTPDHA